MEVVLVLVLLSGFGGGLFLFWMGFRKFRLKRIIENTPTSRIRSMAMGLVEVKGKVIPRKRIKSPLSGVDCVFWQWHVFKWVQSGKYEGNGFWRKVKTVASTDAFYVEDDTGRAIVFPQGAESDMETDYEFIMEPDMPLRPSMEEALQKQGVSYFGFFGHVRLRFREIYVEPGDDVYVLGTAHYWKKQEKASVRGRNEAETERLKKQAEQDALCSASLRSGGKGRWFFISDKKEWKLLEELDWRVPAATFSGPVLAAFSLYQLLKLFSAI